MDLALSIDILLKIMRRYREVFTSSRTSMIRRRKVITIGSFFMIISYMGTYVLQGNEGFLVEASDLLIRIIDVRKVHERSHITIPVLGRFKAENKERLICEVIPATLDSGLQFL